MLSSAEQAVLMEVKKILHNEKESGAGGTVVDFTEVTNIKRFKTSNSYLLYLTGTRYGVD